MGNSCYNISGNPAIVHSPAKASIESMKIYFLPVQEGSGNPSPINIRNTNGLTSINAYQEGKNLINFDNLIQKNFANATTTVNVRMNNMISVCPGAKMTFTSLVTSGRYVRFYDKDGNHQSDYNIAWYNIAESNTFTVPNDSYFLRLMWYNYGTTLSIEQVVASNPVLEYGEKYTGYQKYNERKTISIEMKTIGKNLIHTKYPSRTATGITFTVNADWSITVNGTATATTWLCPALIDKPQYHTFLKAGTYFLSGGKNANKAVYLAGRYVDGTSLSQSWDQGNGKLYTFSKDIWVYPQICIEKNETVNNETFYIQLEQGSSATEYEPYCETERTIYGGYIDPAEGKIVAEYVKISPTKEEFTTQYSSGIGYRQTTPKYSPTASGVIWNTARQQQTCNKAPIANPYSESAETYGEYMGVVFTMEANQTVATARISEALYQTLEEGETVEFTYKLTNPITYNIPKQQLNTLLGTSTYWSNAIQNVDISYKVVDSADMIRARKRIIGQMPHLEETTDMSVAILNTDISTNPKDCLLKFLPLWKGSGTPSSSNIRDIDGVDHTNFIRTRRAIAKFIGFAATTVYNYTQLNNYILVGGYGTTISQSIAESTVVTQEINYDPTGYAINSYRYGYIGLAFDNLEYNKWYKISFDITNITNNPLNATLQDTRLGDPHGAQYGPMSIIGNRVTYKVKYEPHPTRPTIITMELRNCGLSCTLSNVIITAEDEEDTSYELFDETGIKNMFRSIGVERESNGITYTPNLDGTITCKGTATAYSAYDAGYAKVNSNMGKIIISGCTSGSNIVWDQCWLYDSAHTKLVQIGTSGYWSNFTVDLSEYPTAAYLTLKIKRHSNVATNYTLKIQVERGTTVTTFESYFKNRMIPYIEFPTISTNFFKMKASEMISDGWNRYFPNPLKGAPLGNYWIGCQNIFGGNDQQGAKVGFVDKAKNSECTVIGEITNWGFGETIPNGAIFPAARKFTLTAEEAAADYIVFWCNSSGTTIETFLNAHIYIVNSYYGKYEPWSNTLYGGELDLNTGILKITHDSIYLYASGKQYNYFYTTATDMAKGNIESLNADLYCNRLPIDSNVSDTQTSSGITFYANGIIRFLDADYMNLTPDEYNVQQMNNRPFITYKLKNPVYYQLDTQTLKILKGYNAFNSNANTIKIKYWVH